MKTILLLFFCFSLSAFAQPIQLLDHKWSVTDISSLRLTKEALYSSMDRSLVRLKDSICSNRAEVWAWDFKREHKINTAKVFLFYSTNSDGKWWYHAAPVINEKKHLWVMDAGFPHLFKKPLKLNDWFEEFTGEKECRRIRLGENDLIEKIYKEEKFPVKTTYGSHHCYYALAPEGYWTPEQLARGLLGHNENGRPIHFSREELVEDEVYEACLEVSTTPIGRALGRGAKKCNYFISH